MGVCQQLEARSSQLPTELPGKGTGHSRGRRDAGIPRGIASDARAGAPFLAPGEQLGIVPPCPTLARRAAFGAPSPLLVTRGPS
jgi:hypothetical protein